MENVKSLRLHKRTATVAKRRAACRAANHYRMQSGKPLRTSTNMQSGKPLRMGSKRQTATDNYKHAERQTATDGQPLRMDAKRQTATDEYKHAERQTAKQNRCPWKTVTNRDMQSHYPNRKRPAYWLLRNFAKQIRHLSRNRILHLKSLNDKLKNERIAKHKEDRWNIKFISGRNKLYFLRCVHIFVIFLSPHKSD